MSRAATSQASADPAVTLLNAILASGIGLKELAAKMWVSVRDIRDYRAGRKRTHLWLRLRLTAIERERALGLTDLVEAMEQHWLKEIRRRGRNAFPDAQDPNRDLTAHLARFERSMRQLGPLV